ncbi:MAG: ATP-dependent DNA helicase RecG [Treponema sp.]|jgi:ATP-dependent DNA helicase RecG|nr:ATP-dependent DNA helicase RecG [Treponema sp.]
MFLRELTQAYEWAGRKDSAALAGLTRIGINSVAGLLCHYPRKMEDTTRIVPIKDFGISQICTDVQVIAHAWIGFGRMRTLKVLVEDNTGTAALVCFNRSFLKDKFVVGSRFRIWGKFHYKYGEIQSSDFDYETPEEAANSSGLLPIYPLTEGLKSPVLQRLVKHALEEYAASLDDELPQEIILRDGLLHKSRAIAAIHFPSSIPEFETARRTLIYEELFYLEVMIGMRALERRKNAALPPSTLPSSPSPSSPFSPLQQRLIERLPFDLTAGQITAAEEINQDMDGNYPMARLLQGDVGSGKTLVSFLAALRAVEPVPGGQAAIMAPTELLARQHAENAARLLEPLGIRLCFLTGNVKAAGRAILLKRLSEGEIDIVVGTHALFSKDVIYKNLRLVVIDEQHRFGVTQRSLIMSKGKNPNLLMMSATPIPRTLALTVFGDMDVSVIRDMPPGRKPVKTHLAKESNEKKVYDFVRKELAAGRQAYFVYPLIGDNEVQNVKDLKDAVSMTERLSREIFPNYKTALIHSKIDEEEKQRIMNGFRKGEINILAATSVVEVGVDVPNASCMVIEHAERFGLSSLHQLRGRVGRGQDQSYCFLIYSDQNIPSDLFGKKPEELSEEDRTKEGKRLMVMLENSDGFIIAEKDLIFRGPGQITGTEQSGYISLGIADPVNDAAELERARTDVFAILETDPGFLLSGHQCIAETLKRAPHFSSAGL